MSSRARLIVLVLGVVAFGGLLAAGFYFLGLPYLARLKAVKKAEDEAREAQDTLEELQDKAKSLPLLLRGSLPAGPEYKDDPKRQKREYADVAKQEYEQALVKILKDAGVRNSTINYVDGESNSKAGIPQLDPNFKPTKDSDPTEYLAYTQVVFKIDIPKTDLGTLADLLRRYYSLDLLQQIIHLNVKHSGQGEVGEDKRPEKERTDLKVEITTRAIIVHNPPRRRTLTPASNSLTALIGGGGAAVYQNTPSLGRAKPAEPPESLLAYAPPRNYHDLVGKDVYHGWLPEYPPLPPPPPSGGEVIAQPKPDFREFIYYTTSIHTTEGDEHALDITIKDKINKEDYNVLLTQAGEKVRVKVYKFEYNDHKADAAARKTKVYSQDTLEISKWTMSNKNNFTVYGVDTDGSLILGEKPSGLTAELPKEEKKPAGGGRPGFGGGSPKVTLPPPDPNAAVVGGLVVTAPKAEKFYRWESGKSLKQIVELSKPEAEKAIHRAQTRFLPAASGASAEAVPTPSPVAADAGK